MKNKITVLFLLFLIFLIHTTPVFGQQEESYPVYIVQTGDTLYGIALMFDISLNDLLQANFGIDPEQLYIGQSINIPGFKGVSGIITPKVLNLGESWENVLVKFQTNENALIKLNRFLNNLGMYSGQELLIPVNIDLDDFSPKGIVDLESTYLDKVVTLNENPRLLLLKNRKTSALFLFPFDLIYNNNVDQKTINPFSPLIEALSIESLPLIQGDTVVVKVKTLQGLTIEGQLNGQKLAFYTEDNVNYFALQGIHAMSNTGLADFSITGSNGSEQVFSYQQNVLLNSGNYEMDDPITVDPSLVDPAITEPEWDLINSIVSVHSPEKYWDGLFLSPDHDYGSQIPNYDQAKEITSFYGNRRIYNGSPEITFHSGVDFGGGTGLPIVASADGKVVFAGELQVRGHAVIIDHGLGVFSAYFHQSKILVKAGDFVTKGQKIGEVGNTGRVDRADEYEGAGAHLHWEIWVNNVQVNPLDWTTTEFP